jgi:hypothetical protein
MTFKRQDLTEEYNTTADWLQDFARSLEKKSYSIENLNNVKSIINKSKFFTIEEKMADIKQRIGFDIIKEMHSDSEQNTKTASECACKVSADSCECNIKMASSQHPKEMIDSMSFVLKYIKDLIKHEHDRLTTVMVLSRCREEPNLNFDSLPINIEKLKTFIDKELSKYSTNTETPKYLPKDDGLGQSDTNPQAEYWSHAFPQKG